MPELPEVETIRRDLVRLVTGREIISVDIGWPGSIRGPAAEFAKRLIGARMSGFKRRAKMLVIELDSGDRLLIHLKMSGRFLLVPAGAPLDKHTRLTLGIDNGNELRFVDMRKFGYVKMIEHGGPSAVAELDNLGPEPLAADFTEAAWLDLFATKSASRRSIKGLLLDQSFISGLGNIYVDEVLHAAGILPDRRVSTLRAPEAIRIYYSMRAILSEAIEQRGTTFDLYVDATGRRGNYLQSLKVYGRQGKGCAACASPIVKSKVAGRGTHFCPNCQE